MVTKILRYDLLMLRTLQPDGYIESQAVAPWICKAIVITASTIRTLAP